MKAITLTQPWASLVALGAKRIETRSWQTSYRGELAIHAGAGLGPVGGRRGLVELCRTKPFIPFLPQVGWNGADALPRGVVVAVVELVDCVEMVEEVRHSAFFGWVSERGVWQLTDQERAFGDYSPGRYGWLMANVRPLREPVPCRGALGLWDVPAEALPLLKD